MGDEDIERTIKTIFDELDPLQAAIFRQMSPDEKIQRLSDMIGAMRRLALESEREQHPDLAPEELHRRAMARFMRASEWDITLWKTIFSSSTK